MLRPEAKEMLIDNYRRLFLSHGPGPEATQNSAEGQVMRFDQLTKIADLSGSKVLDLGCGIADFYPVLNEKFAGLDYTGIDIVPEMIDYARAKYPAASFQCRDILQDPLAEDFDYVLICGMFNNAIHGATEFLKSMVLAAFQKAHKGLGFNFISNRVNFVDDGMAYHDPADMLTFCIDELSRKTIMCHHYERCDVSVFVYR
jgi:SAM-dependent methyltransferase